jgi:hypothetical protein
MENMETIVAENTERDVQVATPPKADLSKLATEPGLQIDFGQPKPVEEQKPNTEEVKEEVKETVNPESELTVENTEAEKKEGEETTEEVKLDEETVLKLEDESVQNEAEEGSWIAYAKAEGLEITEDTPEAYIAAKIQPLEQKIEEVKNQKLEELLHDVDPEIRMEIELNKSGLSLQDIKAPLDNIARYKSMSDVELYREDLTLRYPNATQEWIDADVEKAVESGQIAHDAVRLRLDLDNLEAQIKQDRQQIVEKYRENNAKFLESKRGSEIESVTKALNEIPSFMGAVIAPESKQIMARKYSEGKYDQILNDPNKRAEFIMYHELGKKAYEAAIAKSEAKGKLSVTKHLSNIPPVENLGNGKSTTEQEQLTGLQKLRQEPGLK